MPHRSYLTFAELSDIWQSGCVPLAWLALFRHGEALDEAPDGGGPATDFWGYRTTVWEATDSLDRAIAILQKQPYLWSIFNVLSLFLEELQQLPSEEAILLDCAEFAEAGEGRARAARAAADSWRLVVRRVQQGELEEALATLRSLSTSLSLDEGLPFSGDLARDVAELGGRTAAREEFLWTITGEMYEGPEERVEFFTAENVEANYWPWLVGLPDEAPPPDAPRNGARPG